MLLVWFLSGLLNVSAHYSIFVYFTIFGDRSFWYPGGIKQVFFVRKLLDFLLDLVLFFFEFWVSVGFVNIYYLVFAHK